jgi:PII-like signaling protein
MDLVGPAKRVRVYVSEADHIGHQPAHLAVLAFLREEHAAGAVVLRAIESLSASGHLHTTRLVDVESKLPVVIEWVDQSHTVERVLPRLKALVPYGLITVEDTEVVLHAPAPVRELTGGLTAAEVMTADVSVVQPDTPARQVVELMLAKGHRAVPVVDSWIRRPFTQNWNGWPAIINLPSRS